MYEQFRNELILELSFVPKQTLDKILLKMDKLSEKYVMTERETRLVKSVVDIPREVKAFLISKKVEGSSKSTLDNYGRTLVNFFRDIQKAPRDITAVDLRVWLYQYQEERGTSLRTMEHYRVVVNNFFVWAEREGMIDKNPVVTVKPIKYEKKQRKALTRVELEILRAACETEREHAIIETFYSTGCRVSELINLKKADVDWRNMTVSVFGKGSKHRTCFINARCEVALTRYLDSRKDDSEFLFVSERKPYGALGKSGMEKIVKKIYDRTMAEIQKKVTPHVLRHTTATIAFQNGMDITHVKEMLGHTNVDTTLIYAEVNQQDVHSEHVKCVV